MVKGDHGTIEGLLGRDDVGFEYGLCTRHVLQSP